MTSERVLLAGLAAGLLGGCSSYDEGIVVSLYLQHGPGGVDVAVGEDARTFMNDRGHSIRLEDGFVAVRAIELVSCSEAILTRAIRELVVPEATALAHEFIPAVRGVDTLAWPDESPVPISELRQAPGDYCSVRVELAPIAESAITARISGEQRTPSGQMEPFTIDVEGGVSAEVDLPERLVLDAERLSASLVIGTRYPVWFEGMDFSGADQASKVRSNLARSVAVSAL